MVLLETPAFARSATDAYGRPAMILRDVAGPTPGRAFRSFSEALFRSTGPLLAAVVASALSALAELRRLELVDALVDAPAGVVAAGVVAAEPDTVTCPRIFSIVLFETPAFERSSTDEYGRPATILRAVAGPTPGKA